MYRDLYDREVTCASQAALDAYVVGMRAAMTLDNSGIPELEHAIELDPDFALAHCLLARQCLVQGQIDRIEPQVNRAEELSSRCQKEEQSSLKAMIASLRHDAAALDLAIEHAQLNPRDVMVLLHIIGPFGLLAFSGRRDWREQNIHLIETVLPHYASDDWWMQATCGFSYAETGDLKKAIECAERSWRLDENGNSAHAIAHAQIEMAAIDDGLSFLDEWDAKMASRSNMRHHMSWHRAMLMLEKGKKEELVEYFGSRLLDQDECTPPLDILADNASLLWRLFLRGVDIPNEYWQSVDDFSARHFGQPGFVFADLHRAMVLAQRSKEECDAFAELVPSPTIANCADAFVNFVDGNYHKAVPLLERAVDESLFVGGSNPQRHVVKETYDAAIERSRQNA